MHGRPAIRLVTTRLIGHQTSLLPDCEGIPAAVKIVVSLVGDKDREHLVVVHLTARNQATSAEIVSIGDLTTAVVHPREVFKAAVLANAAAIIIGHNHPSGDLAPSEDDLAIERNLRLAGIILGIPLVASVIVHGKRSRVVENLAEQTLR